MRRAALALALLALAGTAAGLPVALCADPCVVESDSFGYRPGAIVVASGGSVVWTSFDTGHVTAEDTMMSQASPAPCFVVGHGPGSPSEAVRFDIVGDTVFAGYGGGAEPCEAARPLQGGAFAVPYYCVLHTQMRGAVVVTPA